MAQGKSQFVGAAGQYYLGYGLAVRQVHAAITSGNAPSVDVLASSHDGSRMLSFQVKTSSNAYRRNHYGHEGYKWPVSKAVIGKHWESFWYAFVDLQENEEGWKPRVFFVPSRWVAEFVKPDWHMSVYFLPTSAQTLSEERWDLVQGYLSQQAEAIAWANNWPENILCKW